MDGLHASVARAMAGHGIPRTDALLAAVSGGADSVALLHVLLSLGQRVVVCHVHHGLRGAEADRDAAFVGSLAQDLGVPFRFERVDAARRDGTSPEARARALRYAALERARARTRAVRVATAHTLDDQAETVLLRAARGAGPAGLGGIHPSDAARHLLRPFLSVRRAAVREYLATRGIRWREDGSNVDLRIPRNRVRLEVLDALEAAHPASTEALARLAQASRELAEWMDRLVEEAPGLRTEREGDGALLLERGPLLRMPGPLRRHALARLLAEAGLGERVTSRHLRRVEALLDSSDPDARISLPGDRVLDRLGDRIRLGPAPGTPRPDVPLPPPPGGIDLPDRQLRLEWRPHGGDGGPRRDVLLVPARVPADLRLREAARGDRILLAGDSRPRRLGELFRAAGWPRRARRHALVVTRDQEVVWVVGLGAAQMPGAGRSGGWELRAVRLSSAGASC